MIHPSPSVRQPVRAERSALRITSFLCACAALASAGPAALAALPWAGLERSAPPARSEDALPPADPAVTAAALEHHVRFLAADELRGREAASPEAVRAAHYLARALERAGCAPAGDDGTFLQKVPMIRALHSAPPRLQVWTADGEEIEAEYGVDFDLSVRGEPRSSGRLELLLVSQLEQLPEEPDAGLALFLEGSMGDRRRWLAERGWSDASAFGLEVLPGSSQPGEARGVLAPRLASGAARGEPRADRVRLRGDLRKLLEQGEIEALELTYAVEVEDVPDFNVVARLAGAGSEAAPELAREVVVISAHYDHIGTTDGHGEGHAPEDAPEVDTVFNGADDDASGVAAVLELAEALAAGPAPARTVIFLLATGEEKGLIGTKHYIEHPAEPLAQTVTNLNFEMIGRPDASVGGAGKLWLSGFERTTLGPAWAEAGIEIAPDQRLEQNFFERSDNYAFVLRGIVGQTLSSYDMHEDYHRVSDEADTLDYEHMQRAVRAALQATRSLTSGEVTPGWLPGMKPDERR